MVALLSGKPPVSHDGVEEGAWRVAPCAVAMSTRASRVICPLDSNRLIVDSETPAICARDLRERFCASRAS